MSKCKICKVDFVKTRPLQAVCSINCAMQTAGIKAAIKRVKAEQKDKRETKAKLDAIKPRAKYLAEAQAIANKYARVRDVNEGCISCDKPATWDGQWHGSHFRSVGAASAVRFNLWNIHKACSICNNWKSGNIGEFTPRIIEKIGVDKVEWLKSQNQLKRYDIDYLKKYKKVIGKRLKRMIK
jgi:hypothetical protein